MTNKKICPFCLPGVVMARDTIPGRVYCIEERCMAWEYEYTDLVKPNWEKQVVRHGYCKLI